MHSKHMSAAPTLSAAPYHDIDTFKHVTTGLHVGHAYTHKFAYRTSGATLVSFADDREPSPRHQLQLVQLLLGGRPSLVVLPCSLLWTATGRQGGQEHSRILEAYSCGNRANRKHDARTFSASSDLKASLVASEICNNVNLLNSMSQTRVSNTPVAAHLWHIRVAGAFGHTARLWSVWQEQQGKHRLTFRSKCMGTHSIPSE